jgi:hypothetical protein
MQMPTRKRLRLFLCAALIFSLSTAQRASFALKVGHARGWNVNLHSTLFLCLRFHLDSSFFS